jgi:hypothetical protein
MAKKDIVGGITGAVTAAGFNGDIDAWSAATGVDEETWRTFGSAWKKRANVAYEMTGQFTGTIQRDATATAPMPASTGGVVNDAAFEGVTLTLTADTGCTYSGPANITGLNLSRPAAGRMTGTWQFAFIGQPVQTWDETGS